MRLPALLALFSVVTAIVVLGASASPPRRGILAHRAGAGRLELGASTVGLRHQLLLARIGGTGVARAKVSVSCTRKTSLGTTGSEETFTFSLRPNTRHQVWQYLGSPCTVAVTVTGPGRLNLELRGQ